MFFKKATLKISQNSQESCSESLLKKVVGDEDLYGYQKETPTPTQLLKIFKDIYFKKDLQIAASKFCLS